MLIQMVIIVCSSSSFANISVHGEINMTITIDYFFLNGYNIDMFQSVLARLMGKYWHILFLFGLVITSCKSTRCMEIYNYFVICYNV